MAGRVLAQAIGAAAEEIEEAEAAEDLELLADFVAHVGGGKVKTHSLRKTIRSANSAL
jgi:hypothetical protein